MQSVFAVSPIRPMIGIGYHTRYQLMHHFVPLSVILLSSMLLGHSPQSGTKSGPPGGVSQNSGAGQLLAVRGEVVKIRAPSKGMLLITVKPAREFGEVTVLARENDL